VRDGGDTIRMYGVVNALAEQGEEVILLSNAVNYSNFHPAIRHVFLDVKFSQKALFQGLLAILPPKLMGFLYSKMLSKISAKFSNYNSRNNNFIFFEYLDNSFAYLLYKCKKINHYINDIHGVAPIEFNYVKKLSKNPLKKLFFLLKLMFAEKLDKKMFENARGLIYSSQAMKAYFENKYDLKNTQFAVLPNLISENVRKSKIDSDLLEKLRVRYEIKEKDFILLFVGGYKATSGLDDLVQVFCKLSGYRSNMKLILIGYGPVKKEVEKLVKDLSLNDKVFFIEKVPYEKLYTYQSLAHIVVCPDKENEFSNLIVHLKYLDSLVSGKPVVASNFKSVAEINVDDSLSVGFKPSDKKDLYEKIKYCMNNYDDMLKKYAHVREYAFENLTYKSHINALTVF
jgi:glycosyltransferase involved in cell wall biosynthesis